MRSPFFTTVVFVLAWAATAAADVVVTVEKKDLAVDPPTVDTQMIYMTPDKLSAEGEDGNGGKVGMIYRGDRGLIWTIDHASKSYVEMDRAAMAKMGEQLDAAMKQMQAQMAQMPEEQRKMVEQMMKDKSGATSDKKPVVEIKPSSAKQTVAGKSCSRWDVNVDGVKTAEMWGASWKDAGVDKESFAAFHDLAAFMQTLMDSSPVLANAIREEGGMFQGLDKVDACPVLIRSFADGKVVDETLFKSVQPGKVEASRFEVPAGYAKKSLGG